MDCFTQFFIGVFGILVYYFINFLCYADNFSIFYFIVLKFSFNFFYL